MSLFSVFMADLVIILTPNIQNRTTKHQDFMQDRLTRQQVPSDRAASLTCPATMNQYSAITQVSSRFSQSFFEAC